MRRLSVAVVSASGRSRAALVVGSTAVTSGLLLVACSIARVDSDPTYGIPLSGPDHLFMPIADPGTRPGAVLAVVLMVMPLLLLLDQAVRLGSSARERRYAALAVAGATRRDLRRWGAFEVGAPAVVGALLGVPVWLLLRAVLGRPLADEIGALVPPDVGPGPLAVPVLVAVAAYGLLVGARVGARTADPLREARGLRARPRPWPALLIVAGVAVLLNWPMGGWRETAGVVSVLLIVAGAGGVAPWAAYRSAGVVARRTSSPETLLGARRLMADPRPAGRAAAAVGAVALTAGVLSGFVPDVMDGDVYDPEEYLVPAAVVGVLAVVGLLLTAGSLTIHSAETVLRHRREMATLVATGVPARVVSLSQRRECLIATLPLTLAGTALGGVGYGYLTGLSGAAYAWIVVAVVVTPALVWLAVRVTTRLLRPWVIDTIAIDQVRTE